MLYNDKKRKPTSTGWECPRCGQVNSPSVMQCSCSPALKPYEPIKPSTWPTYPTQRPLWCDWTVTYG